MDILFSTIESFLNAVIPSGAAHATEWYTLNEMIAYIFVICLFLSFIVRILQAFRVIPNRKERG